MVREKVFFCICAQFWPSWGKNVVLKFVIIYFSFVLDHFWRKQKCIVIYNRVAETERYYPSLFYCGANSQVTLLTAMQFVVLSATKGGSGRGRSMTRLSFSSTRETAVAHVSHHSTSILKSFGTEYQEDLFEFTTKNAKRRFIRNGSTRKDYSTLHIFNCC